MSPGFRAVSYTVVLQLSRKSVGPGFRAQGHSVVRNFSRKSVFTGFRQILSFISALLGVRKPGLTDFRESRVLVC